MDISEFIERYGDVEGIFDVHEEVHDSERVEGEVFHDFVISVDIAGYFWVF